MNEWMDMKMCWIIEMIHGCLIKNKTNRKRPIIAEFLIRWFRSMRVHRPEWARKSTEKTILNGNWHTRRPQATINRMHSIKQPNKIQSKKTDAHTEIIYDGNLFIQIVVCSEDLIDTTGTDTRESCQRSMDKYKSRKLSQPWGIHIYRKNILPPNACFAVLSVEPKLHLASSFPNLGCYPQIWQFMLPSVQKHSSSLLFDFVPHIGSSTPRWCQPSFSNNHTFKISIWI